MGTMVEKVTAAIRATRKMSLCDLCDRHNAMIRCSCEELAVAAIKAMRPPRDARKLTFLNILEKQDMQEYAADINRYIDWALDDGSAEPVLDGPQLSP